MRRDKSNHVTSGSDEDLSSTYNQPAFPTIEDLILDVKKKTIESGEGTSVSPRGNTTKCASAPKSLRRRLVLLLLSLTSISIITNLIIGDTFFQHESNNDEHSFSPPRVEQSPATLSTTKTLDKITTLSAARAYKLTPIQPASLSATHYTIRINTWRRNELLLASLNHHAKCEGVHSIQVIWCDAENDPPDEVAQHKSGKVIVERHEVNSLNERWRIMTSNTTIGILSLDDDVLRPCEAYDVAFIRWSRHPERLIGFDPRLHHIYASSTGTDQWKYGFSKENLYSLTLPSKAAFIHRDYLHLYTTALPRAIYKHIEENFQCEDIAMSYLVSSLTKGEPPLMADWWATKSEIKLYSENGISWKEGHMRSRDVCVTMFAEMMGIKEGPKSKGSGLIIYPLQTGSLHQDSFTVYGSNPENWGSIKPESMPCLRLQNIVKTMQWLELLGGQEMTKTEKWLECVLGRSSEDAKAAGLVRGTIQWKMRWWYNVSIPPSFPSDPSMECKEEADTNSVTITSQPTYKLHEAVYSEKWVNVQKKDGHCPWNTNQRRTTNSTRCDLQLLLQRLIARIPFSYVHFNDGEVKTMMQSSGQTDRGMQTLSPELRDAMLSAFRRESSGLVFGLPCPFEFKDKSDFAEKTLNNSSVERTLATAFVNSNYKDSKEVLIEYLKRNLDRNLHMVVSDSANVTSFEEHTGLHPKTITRVSGTDAFPAGYHENINSTQHHLPGDIVIICAGPLGRILAVEWFLQHPNTTFLELGSYFDLELFGKSFGARYYSMDANMPNCGSTLRIQRDILMTLTDIVATDRQ